MNVEITERPLITFALFAYNQEKYVREAVEGAFGQTYRPLEIILSDDCSGDRTFEVMRDMASAYRMPHQIILNRNDRNLGIPAHVNQVMKLAHGQLVVAAAGDDISLPERCELTYKTWLRHDRRHYSIAMGFEPLYDTACAIRKKPRPPVDDVFQAIRRATADVIGASYAWHRGIFEAFGPLPTDIPTEDHVLSFRSLLLGGIAFDPTPVVRYRLHSGNYLSTFAREHQGWRGRMVYTRRKYQAAQLHVAAFAKDIDRAFTLGLITDRERQSLQNAARDAHTSFGMRARLLDPDRGVRIRTAIGILHRNPNNEYSLKRRLFYLLAAISPYLYVFLDLKQSQSNQLLAEKADVKQTRS